MFRRIQPHNTTVTGFNEDHPMSGRQDCADGILFTSTCYTTCINNMLQRKSKKKHTTMTCCFFQRKISNKQQKLIPKGLICIFHTMRRNQGFFLPKHFAQTCATSPGHLFFVRTNLGRSAVREDIPAGCHLETKMALYKTQHGCLP